MEREEREWERWRERREGGKEGERGESGREGGKVDRDMGERRKKEKRVYNILYGFVFTLCCSSDHPRVKYWYLENHEHPNLSHYGLTSCFDDKVFNFWTQIPTHLVQADIHISFRPSKTSQSSLQIDSHGIFYTAHLSHIWDVGLCVLISHEPLISNVSGQLEMKRGEERSRKEDGKEEEGRWKGGGGKMERGRR